MAEGQLRAMSIKRSGSSYTDVGESPEKPDRRRKGRSKSGITIGFEGKGAAAGAVPRVVSSDCGARVNPATQNSSEHRVSVEIDARNLADDALGKITMAFRGVPNRDFYVAGPDYKAE